MLVTVRRFVASVLASCVLSALAPAQGPPVPFLRTGSKREQCATLDAWLARMYAMNPGIAFNHAHIDQIPRLVAPAFADSIFIPMFGKSYGALSAGERGAIQRRTQSGCPLMGWAQMVLPNAFAKEKREPFQTLLKRVVPSYRP